MLANSVRAANWYRAIYRDASVSGSVASGTNGVTALIAAKTGFTLWIQKITVYITTDAAQSITFQDNATTPIHVLEIPASAGDGTDHEIDYGPRGFALTADKQLDIAQSAAGPAYNYTVDAYWRQTIGSSLSVAQLAAS